MSDYIDRMKAELTALNTMRSKLSEFMGTDTFSTLSHNAMRLMQQQERAMYEYSVVLFCRIELAQTEAYNQKLNVELR